RLAGAAPESEPPRAGPSRATARCGAAVGGPRARAPRLCSSKSGSSRRAPLPTRRWEPRAEQTFMATRKKAKSGARKLRKAARRRPKTPVRRKAARKSSRKTRAAKTPARRKDAAIPLPPPAAKAVDFLDSTAAPRCRSRIPVEIDVHGRRERGAIADMSASGARIVGVRLNLPPGTPLQIRYASGAAPVLLAAEIVRQTADGFAVKILPR